MKRLLILGCLFVSLTAQAQIIVPISQDLRKGIVIDTARYRVTYSLKYKNHPSDKAYLDDVRNVYIGRNYVKDFSDIIFHFDSLRTEESKRGATALSNVQGDPWPIELTLGNNSRKAEIKYRMPMQTGVLLYQQDVPSFNWTFTEEVDTILGYACAKAIAPFAGREYTAWFSMEIPLPFGPYKFGGLPGLILKVQDNESQYIWEAMGFEKMNTPIFTYRYEGEKKCSVEEASKTISRIFKSPLSFIAASMGGAKITMLDKNGKPNSSDNPEAYAISYKALENEEK